MSNADSATSLDAIRARGGAVSSADLLTRYSNLVDVPRRHLGLLGEIRPAADKIGASPAARTPTHPGRRITGSGSALTSLKSRLKRPRPASVTVFRALEGINGPSLEQIQEIPGGCYWQLACQRRQNTGGRAARGTRLFVKPLWAN